MSLKLANELLEAAKGLGIQLRKKKKHIKWQKQNKASLNFTIFVVLVLDSGKS
jgi:hypothetical protein